MARTVGVSRCAVGSQRCVSSVEARRIGDGEDDVVLLDDALVEAVGLLVGEAERRLEHRLLPEALDLEGRPEREVREDADRDEHRGQEHEAGESLRDRPAMRRRVYAAAPRERARGLRARAEALADPLGVGDDAVARDELGELLGDVREGVALGLGERLAVERVHELDRAEEAPVEDDGGDEQAAGAAERRVPLDGRPFRLRLVGDDERAPLAHRREEQRVVLRDGAEAGACSFPAPRVLATTNSRRSMS